jgi:hypothetical protein
MGQKILTVPDCVGVYIVFGYRWDANDHVSIGDRNGAIHSKENTLLF